MPDDNVDVVQGEAASAAGIATALDRLAARAQPGDQVFLYYAGPGVIAGAPPACEGAWVAADGGVLTAGVVATHLRPALTVAGKTFVVTDTGFRPTLGTPAQRAIAGDTRACDATVSTSMPLVDATRNVGAGASNVVHLQPVGTLQGLEQAAQGGLFTQALVDCMAGDATDQDGSGAVSIAEIAACIDQQALHAGARERTTWARVDGNARFVPALAVPLPTGDPTTSARNAPADPALSPRAALEDILAQRDDRIAVEVVADPPSLVIGKDRLGLQVRSNRSGYLYLILLGSDEKSFYLLFPNDLDRDNRIDADQPLRLPRPQWTVQSQGPPGVNVVVAVVAESPRNLALVQGRKAGPFSDVLTDPQGRATLQWLVGRSAEADGERCGMGGGRRNLQVVASCSDAYGAARVEVVER